MDLNLRKTYRKQLTTLVNQAEDIVKREVIDIDELPVLSARIKAVQRELNAINEKLASTFKEDEQERECEKIVEYNDKAVEAIARLDQRWRNQAVSDNVEPQAVPAELPTENADNVINNEVKYTVRLPKIYINKFDGDIAAWPSFWEQYCSAIHENCNLDDATKFAYLKSYLTGRAALTIAGLTSSQLSYKDAVELLKSEYANTERIVDTYIQKLLSITPVKFDKDIPNLRKLYNSALTITKSLTTLGISSEQYGLLVKSIIFKALPYNMRITFNKQKIKDAVLTDSDTVSELTHTSTSDSTINYNKQIIDLLQFIKVELDSVEQARGVYEWDSKEKHRNQNSSDKSKFTAAGLFISAKDYCLFCPSKSHLTRECDCTLSMNDKKDILKRKRLCYRCIKPNHNSRMCKTRDVICAKCRRRHATSMCDPTYNRKSNDSHTSNNVQNKTGDDKSVTLLTNEPKNNVYLQTACANIVTNNTQDKVLIRLIIDGGSQLSFIKESLSRQLGLAIIGTHKIAIQSFGKSTRAPARLCNRVKINLTSHFNDEIIEIIAVEVPEICFDSLKPPSMKDQLIQEFSKQYKLADTNSKQQQRTVNGITLLIGADNYWKVITGETQRLSEELTAVNSKFGWTIHGASWLNDYYNFMVNVNSVTVMNVQTEFEDIDIKNFWSLETIGINANDKVTDNFTSDFIENKIVLRTERYEVALPWKTERKLDSNYAGAVVRVNSLIKRLLRNGKLNEYDCAIREYIKSNCAEIVPVTANSAKTYYMPHQPVYREDKNTTKVRVVYDASAHAPGFESLNEQLYSGENLVADLLKILLSFRFGSVGLIADIEKAFLQISINEKDRDAHRFLWYEEPIKENISSSSELPQLTTYRMKRVTFGVTSSPFLLSATLRKHLSNQPEKLKETAEILAKSFYVDDLIVAVSSVEQANVIYDQSKEILQSANMNLRKWFSNNSEVNKRLNQEDEISRNEENKILGILWNKVTDELSVNLSHIINDKQCNFPTKRNILQAVARIFDPMGMLGPYTVRAKILLQCLWKKKLDWDSNIPDECKTEWMKWCVESTALTNFRLPRSVLHCKENEVELHVFADASLQAYGAVAYLKCLVTNNCNFLIAKNRVAPVTKKGQKQLTLPKLELTAALCAARLQAYILKNLALNIETITIWSDSKITLYWIKGDIAKREIYIQNRVNEIRKLTQEKWRYCPSKDNPADSLTRGISAKALVDSKMWLNGPSWLRQNSSDWPPDDINDDNVETTRILFTLNETQEIRSSIMEPIFEVHKFGRLEKIVRVTAYISRFVNNISKTKKKKFGPLNVEELMNAEKYWIKYTQRSSFIEEISALSKQKSISTRSSILTLNPFLDSDGILRLGGRLDEALLPYGTKHPIILPKKLPYTTKIIARSHERVMHAGVNATLNEVRKKYWILQGRQQVKVVYNKCLRCKRLKGKSGNEPFAPLPKNRMLIASPFKFTGIDFAGPLYVKLNNNRVKVYIMLMTCAVIRAVHLELVPDLTVESCIRGLRRFIARRGVPAAIYSDNAKTFKRTAQEIHELSNLLTTEPVQELARKHRMEWHFIVERAAWWGGFWERLVKVIKDALKLTLGRIFITYDELQTILTEVEATVNSRPLTYIDEDPSNLLILSPSHFLIGENDQGFSVDLTLPEIKRNEILRQWKEREKLIAKFWKRWSTDYLQQLRSAHHTTHVKHNTLKVGDVALLQEQHVPRLNWKLVRIISVFQGRDGKVRACEIQTSTGTRLRRPIQLLYPLEVDTSPPGRMSNIITQRSPSRAEPSEIEPARRNRGRPVRKQP